MLSEIWPVVLPLITSGPVLSYNVYFDGPMIRRSAAKYGLEPPPLTMTCAMKLFSAFRDTDDWLSLAEACTMIGIDQSVYGQAHGALADTLATVDLLRQMIREVEA